MDTKEFVQKAINIHGHIYGYEKTVYENYKTKVIITCKIHGDFMQLPPTHLHKSGCKQCFYDKSRTSVDNFIAKSITKYGNRFDYNKVEYKSANKKITLTCKSHGDFSVRPSMHLSNRGNGGCMRCYEDTKITTTEKFIKKALSIHNAKYSYEKSLFVSEDIPIEITCKKHGSFWQRKQNHINGAGCQKCAKESCKKSLENFILQASVVHDNIYDYSKAIYTGSFDNIEIICKNHGSFFQYPSNHLKGSKCPKCISDKSRSSIQEFIETANAIHQYKYDYSESEYTRAIDKIKIICPKHGEFYQKASNHLQGQGCPSCPTIISKQQSEIIDVLKSFGVDIVINERKTFNGKEIDIYCPSHNFGIEYHGLYWHSYNQHESKQDREIHQAKALMALDKNIRLFQIFEHEWLQKKDIIISMIKHRLYLSNKIYARDCEIAYDLDIKDFLDNNHLQGFRPAKHNICLLFNKELVMVASYSKHQKYNYELIRMATSRDNCVVGGVSKLMKQIKNHIQSPLATYADLRYSDAIGYINAGFKKIEYTKPGYFYYHDRTRAILSRQKCQKHKLSKLLPHYDENISEPSNMFNNGYRRVWDAGHTLLVL